MHARTHARKHTHARTHARTHAHTHTHTHTHKYFRRLYLAKKSNWRLLMAPRLLVRMTSTASSYFMPSSISATATKTGARPRPVTQCTPTQVSGSSLNSFLTNPSHFSTISWEGGDPSVKEISVTETPASPRSSVL